MVKQVRDLPENDAIATMGAKLRAAREETGKSRATVQKETGISAKALEHYENGTSQISISRLEQLCGLYGLDMKDVLSIDAGESTGALPGSENADVGAMSTVEAMLADLAGFRAAGFEGSQRRAMALVDDLSVAMKRLEGDELEALAAKHGLFEGERPTANDIFGLFVDDLEASQELCSEVEARIIDTAIIGTDLYGFTREALVDLAEDLQEDFDISQPRMGGFSWGDHKDFVPVIREPLRKLALMGKGIDFTDPGQFPRRELKTAA